MHLPTWWREAVFSVAETAEIIGVSEITLRTWLMRNPFPEFCGKKEGHRVFFSPQTIFFYALIHQLGSYGVPIRTAMAAASGYADHEFIFDEWLIVRSAGQHTQFEIAEDIPLTPVPSLILPLRAMAINVLAKAGALREKEGS